MTGYLSKIMICYIDQIWYKTSLKKLECRFIKYLEWPPSSPDVNRFGFEQLNSFSLDYEPLKKNRDIL